MAQLNYQQVSGYQFSCNQTLTPITPWSPSTTIGTYIDNGNGGGSFANVFMFEDADVTTTPLGQVMQSIHFYAGNAPNSYYDNGYSATYSNLITSSGATQANCSTMSTVTVNNGYASSAGGATNDNGVFNVPIDSSGNLFIPYAITISISWMEQCGAMNPINSVSICYRPQNGYQNTAVTNQFTYYNGGNSYLNPYSNTYSSTLSTGAPVNFGQVPSLSSLAPCAITNNGYGNVSPYVVNTSSGQGLLNNLNGIPNQCGSCMGSGNGLMQTTSSITSGNNSMTIFFDDPNNAIVFLGFQGATCATNIGTQVWANGCGGGIGGELICALYPVLSQLYPASYSTVPVPAPAP